METIGQRLLELRKKHRYTQEDLAGELEVSRQSISNWELDKSLPDTERLFALAKLYEVSLDELAYGKKNPVIDDKDLVANHDAQPDGQEQEDGDRSSLTKEYGEAATSSKNPVLYTALVCGLIITAILLIGSLLFTIGITKRFADDSDVMNSEIVYIDEIIEQYSYVEVSKLDVEGNYAKDRVWLDTRNLSEGDTIFCFTDVGNPKKMKFEYYTKTLVVPLCVTFALLLLECVFAVTLWSCKSRKKKEEV